MQARAGRSGGSFHCGDENEQFAAHYFSVASATESWPRSASASSGRPFSTNRLSTGLEKLPICSSTKVPPRRNLLRDRWKRVKAIVAEGLSVDRVNFERLRELRPDFYPDPTQCAVCAVTPREPEQALCTGTGVPPIMVHSSPTIWGRLDDFRSCRRSAWRSVAGRRRDRFANQTPRQHPAGHGQTDASDRCRNRLA